MTTAVASPAPRDPFSHVNRDGLAKRSFESERHVAIEASRLEGETGKRFNWYVCAQGPAHWHLSRMRLPGAPA